MAVSAPLAGERDPAMLDLEGPWNSFEDFLAAERARARLRSWMVEGGVGDLSDRELLVVGLLRRNHRGVQIQHEVGRLILKTCLECDSIHHVSEGDVFVCEVCGYEHLGEPVANEFTVLASKTLSLLNDMLSAPEAHRGSILTTVTPPCRRGRVVGCAEHDLWAYSSIR